MVCLNGVAWRWCCTPPAVSSESPSGGGWNCFTLQRLFLDIGGRGPWQKKTQTERPTGVVFHYRMHPNCVSDFEGYVSAFVFAVATQQTIGAPPFLTALVSRRLSALTRACEGLLAS